MIGLFAPLFGRFKALFVREAALDLEVDLLQHNARRTAQLERLAQSYEEEGVFGAAKQFRNQAAAFDADRPLAGVLPSVKHLSGDFGDSERAGDLPLQGLD